MATPRKRERDVVIRVLASPVRRLAFGPMVVQSFAGPAGISVFYDSCYGLGLDFILLRSSAPKARWRGNVVPGILIQLTTVGKNPIDFQNHPSLRTKIHSDQDLPLDHPLTDAHVGWAFVPGLRNL